MLVEYVSHCSIRLHICMTDASDAIFPFRKLLSVAPFLRSYRIKKIFVQLHKSVGANIFGKNTCCLAILWNRTDKCQVFVPRLCRKLLLMKEKQRSTTCVDITLMMCCTKMGDPANHEIMIKY